MITFMKFVYIYFILCKYIFFCDDKYFYDKMLIYDYFVC